MALPSTFDNLRALARTFLLVAVCASATAFAQDDDSDQTVPPPSGVRHVVRHHVDAPAEGGDSAKPEGAPPAEPEKPPAAAPAKATAHPKKKAPAKKPVKHKKAKPAPKHQGGGSPV